MLWNLIFILVAALFSLTLIGTTYQFLGSALDRKRFPRPGSLIKINHHRLHVHRQGEGTPTVVFDSALGGSSLSWDLVQSDVAQFTATLSYDRAGFGWSEPGPLPRSVEQIVKELHELLKRAGVPGPYVLVGHSYGGFTVRLYADLYPEEVAGMVLVDAAEPEEWIRGSGVSRRKVETGARLARRGILVARLGIARLVVSLARLGAEGPARRIGSLLSEGLPTEAQDRLLSPVKYLSAHQREVLRWFWTQPTFFEALASQIETIPKSAKRVTLTGPYGDLPLVVLSADNPDPTWKPRQKAMARLSRMGRHIHASGTGHWILLEQPDLVVEAIHDVVKLARLRSSHRTQGTD
ncbi:alpha/beta hydrolase [Acidobacteria bacterium AH-259-D05]|nr:alpha/beta hydrolase [Acidobacteria bacterium AH-259-D05]